MMKIKALTVRILKQLLNDKRTIALIVVAPIVVLSLVYYVLCENTTEYTVGVINAPKDFLEEIENTDDEDNIVKTKYVDPKDIEKEIKQGEIIAALDMDDDLKKVKIYIDGTDNT